MNNTLNDTTNIPRLTRRQAAIIGMYTGILAGPWEDVHSLGDELMGYPTMTHQYGDKNFVNILKEKVQPLFLNIVAQK
jgi:hypothetical protein